MLCCPDQRFCARPEHISTRRFPHKRSFVSGVEVFRCLLFLLDGAAKEMKWKIFWSRSNILVEPLWPSWTSSWRCLIDQLGQWFLNSLETFALWIPLSTLTFLWLLPPLVPLRAQCLSKLVGCWIGCGTAGVVISYEPHHCLIRVESAITHFNVHGGYSIANCLLHSEAFSRKNAEALA